MDKIIDLDYPERQLISLKNEPAPKKNSRFDELASWLNDPEVPIKQRIVVGGVAAGWALAGLSAVSATAIITVPTLIATGVAGAIAAKYATPDHKIVFCTKDQMKGIVFPLGHPREGLVYVGHPGMPSRYYLFSDFHIEVFKTKIWEIYRLLVSLGASEITFEYKSGWSKEAQLAIAAMVPAVTESKFTANSSEYRGSKISLKAELGGSSDSAIPADLIWYEREPGWKELAESRVSRRLKKFELELSSIDSYGVDGALRAVVNYFGLSIGGRFCKHEITNWIVTGTFL